MKKLLMSAAMAVLAVLAGVSTLQWAVGSNATPSEPQRGPSAIASPGAADVNVSIPSLPLPAAGLVGQQNTLNAQAAITNNGPDDDEIVSIETMDVPAGCEGALGDSKLAVGNDVAVRFGTLPAMNIGDPFNLSRTLGITCATAGLYNFKYRLEAQPLFGSDANQSDNLRTVPFSLCIVPDLTSDFDADGIATPDEPTYGTNACNPDTDGDGCLDGREIAASHSSGGQRSPTNGFDFFDVPVPYSATFTLTGKDRAITGADVLAVRVGTGHVAGDGVYNAQYDRTPSTVPGQPWRSGPPNGTIGAQDLLVIRDSTGDSCQ